MSKIYELAEQAAEFAVLNPSDEVLQSETEDVKVEIPKAFIDQFAELIVRECMDVVRDINQEYDGGSTVVNAADEIKDYFGV